MSRNLFLLALAILLVLSTSCASRRHHEPDVTAEEKQYVLPTAKRIR